MQYNLKYNLRFLNIISHILDKEILNKLVKDDEFICFR